MLSVAYKRIHSNPVLDIEEPPQLNGEDEVSLSRLKSKMWEDDIDDYREILITKDMIFTPLTVKCFPSYAYWNFVNISMPLKKYTLGSLNVAVLLFDNEGNLLWRRQSNNASKPEWSLSAFDYVESQETLQEASERSLTQQLDIDDGLIQSFSPLAIFVANSNDSSTPIIESGVNIIYGAMINEPENHLSPPSPTVDLLWSPLNSPPSGLTQFSKSTILAIEDMYPNIQEEILLF